MANPIWDSFVTDHQSTLISKAEELKQKIIVVEKENIQPFSNEEAKVANLSLILKTAQIERQRLESVYNQLQIESRNFKRISRHQNIGGENGPSVEIYSGFFFVI